MSDILYVGISGDRKAGEAYIGFARKKLAQIIALGVPQKKIILENGTVIQLQHTQDRQNIFITVPSSEVIPKKKRKLEPIETGGLLFFYGMPHEYLLLTDIEGVFPGVVKLYVLTERER